MSFFAKFWASLKREGWGATLAKIASLPSIVSEELRVRKALKVWVTAEERFTWIYKSNHWKSSESVSGSGSTLEYTENLRAELPGLLERLDVKTLFDAPCGDFNWMPLVLEVVDVDYTGADIVKPLIDSLNSQHSNSKTRFVHLDLIQDPHAKADLMICRDALFHLSFKDAKSVLKGFVSSKTKFLLTTCHFFSENQSNTDIKTGDFRPLDLRIAPFNLPRDFQEKVADWKFPDPERYMVLWTRDQIQHAIASWPDQSAKP